MSGYYPKQSKVIADISQKIAEYKKAIQSYEDLLDEAEMKKHNYILDNKEYIKPEDFKQFNNKKISELTLIYSINGGSPEFAYIDSSYNFVEIKDGYITCETDEYNITKGDNGYCANDAYFGEPQEINIIGIYDVVLKND